MREYWYIWYRVYENGVLIKESQYHKSYSNRSGARYRAIHMWGEPTNKPIDDTTTGYIWKVSETYPWNGLKGDRF